MKEYGHYDDASREYVINDPATPWPWINYLGNEDFFSLISQTAGGYSFYRDAKFRRINLAMPRSLFEEGLDRVVRGLKRLLG